MILMGLQFFQRPSQTVIWSLPALLLMTLIYPDTSIDELGNKSLGNPDQSLLKTQT